MKKFIVASLIIIFSVSQLKAQASDYVSAVRIGDAKEKMPVTVSATLISPENISSVNLFFKKFGENEYRNVEMLIAGNTASATIKGEFVIPPYLDYYLLLALKNGTTQSYPLGIEQGFTPLQIAVSGVSDKDKEILILSPSDGEILSQESLLISISFFKAPDNIDIKRTKIYLNNEDVTKLALVTNELLVISGESFESNLSTGSRLLKVEVYDKEGKLYHTISRSFQVVTAAIAEEVSTRWKSAGNLRAESRSETFNTVSTWYNNLSADFNASYEQWNVNGYLYLTSEEKKNLQPYNRYSAHVTGGEWLELRVGDTYPRFPSLIMDGKRIRGFSGQLNLGFINVAAAIGESDRKVEGVLLETYTKDQVPLGTDIIPINATKYGKPFAKVNLGTYQRD
ncbi:MAG: hypothetical protein GYA14_08680, partial [Ignavibacteria bacterium]|nr:hypothetical protein [Ignavibacteria bacterium]